MGMFVWPLLGALGVICHFRLAAFGRSSSERVKSATGHRSFLLQDCKDLEYAGSLAQIK